MLDPENDEGPIHGMARNLRNRRRRSFAIVSAALTIPLLVLCFGDSLASSVAGPYTFGMLLITLQVLTLTSWAMWYAISGEESTGKAERA